VHVHQGDVYYAMSRWDRPPGFAACNDNTFAMSRLNNGQVDLCGASSRFMAASGIENSSITTQADGRLSNQMIETLSSTVLTGWMGLYGGDSCAHYTLEADFITADENCSTATTATCSGQQARQGTTSS